MSREESKKAAKELLDLCAKEGVKVPTDLRNAMVQAGTMLNATREDGKFQIQIALQEMIHKFGKSTASTSTSSSNNTKRQASEIKQEDKKKDKENKLGASTKRKRSSTKAIVVDSDSDDEDATINKPKATKARAKKTKPKNEDADDEQDDKKRAKRSKPSATCEENQELAAAFSELAGFEFKRGERFKGGTWSKVAKAIRDAEKPIVSGKEALKLKGVGKSSAAKIDEFLESGTLQLLEEFRAGNM